MSFGRRNVEQKPKQQRRRIAQIEGEVESAHQGFDYVYFAKLGAGLAGVLIVAFCGIALLRAALTSSVGYSSSGSYSASGYDGYEAARRSAQSQQEYLQLQLNEKCNQLYDNPTDRHFCKQVD